MIFSKFLRTYFFTEHLWWLLLLMELSEYHRFCVCVCVCVYGGGGGGGGEKVNKFD